MTNNKILQLLKSSCWEDNIIGAELLSVRSLYDITQFFQNYGVRGLTYTVTWTDFVIKIGFNGSDHIKTIRNDQQDYVLWLGHGDLLLVNGTKYTYDKIRNT